mmetsp:Transcript_92178/g.144666  ORF Transcript_92178/g.144666 Transcript_92178/m.144666 type:complete len:303 (+) Transcript_92178:93-1001(+)
MKNQKHDRSKDIEQKLKEKAKKSQSNNWSILIVLALTVALIAWWNTGMKASKSKKAVGNSEPDEEETDERLDAIREALFSEDGVFSNGKRADGKRGFGFAQASYWEERYSKSKQDFYDWYGTWNSDSKIRIKQHVSPWLPTNVQSVLNVGCGNSRFAEELASDGYSDIVSVDIAQAAIDRMNEKFKGVQGLKFMQMDATQMTFEDASFDLVFEKGTFDAMYTGAAEAVKLTVAQVFRVLRPGGVFISLTFGPPKARKDLNYTSGEPSLPSGWEQFVMKKIHKEEDGLAEKQSFYIYIMKKPA